MNVTLYEMDAYFALRKMIERGEFVDGVCCDPPYGLVSVTKRFGKSDAAPAKFGRDGAFARQSKGFMGQTWDGTAIERDPEFWRLVYQVMKPGAYIVAFSSSRTYHHMAVAMERAGFVTHPMIGWTFSSGFPKAHNAARAIDQALGQRGEIRASGDPVRRIRPGADQNKDGTWEKLQDREYQPGIYEPATDEAAAWQGWHYGGQARKPALEPIYVGQKPFSEANGALNIMKHGVGAVNIDGCRVDEGGLFEAGDIILHRQGRWPANLIHDGSPEVVALFPDSKGQLATSSSSSEKRKNQNVYGQMKHGGPVVHPRKDDGSAARFFESYSYRCFECRDAGWVGGYFGFDAWQESCPACRGMCNDPIPFEGRPIFHYPKANKRDRAGSRHPTVKPILLLRALIRHIVPVGGIVLDPFAGSGTTGQAAEEEGINAILIEREPTYAADIRRRLDLERLLESLLSAVAER